jgi:hypothetical protein
MKSKNGSPHLTQHKEINKQPVGTKVTTVHKDKKKGVITTMESENVGKTSSIAKSTRAGRKVISKSPTRVRKSNK